MRFLRQNPGFTLVEILVSLFIFSVVSTIAATMYNASIDLERQSTSHRAVQQNGSFLTEYVGKEVRNGVLDYDAYTLESIDLNLQPVARLKLLYRGTQDQSEEIYLDDGHVMIRRERAGEQDVYDIAPLTDDTVIVENLAFYVAPAQKCIEDDPVCSQQRVTMVLKMDSNTIELNGAQGITIYLQTTFSARLYDI